MRSIIADVLILDENEVGDDDHFVMDLGGDSLSVIGVITRPGGKVQPYDSRFGFQPGDDSGRDHEAYL